MHENQEIFTITLITDGENSKLLLSTDETPAKEDSEASGVIYKQDLPEQFDEITSKIPVFKTALEEDGNEESITHSVEEFLDLYDLDLINVIEQGEEILHVDLDNDEAEEGDENHTPGTFDDSDLDDYDETGPDPFAIYGDNDNSESYIDPRDAF